MGKEQLPVGKRFGPDEQLAEGRVLPVGVVGRHRELDVAGQVELPDAGRAVDQGDPPHFHVTYDGGNPAVVATVSGEADATTQLAVEQADEGMLGEYMTGTKSENAA